MGLKIIIYIEKILLNTENADKRWIWDFSNVSAEFSTVILHLT
jgi:hypothetical protein